MDDRCHRARTLWTFAITSIALFMVTLDNLVVSTALPVIRNDLGASIEELEWTVNAYTLTFAVFLLTGAALGDRFGRRRMFAIGLGIFTVASAAAALAPSMDALDRRPRGPGPRRRDRHAADADDPLGGVPGRAARRRARRLGRRSAASPSRSARSSAAPSSRASRGSGSSGSTSRSGSLLIPLAIARLRRDARPATRRSTCPASRSRARGLLGIVWGLVNGNGRRLDEPEIVASLAAGVALLVAFVALGARAPSADAADALLPQPRLLGRERRVARDVLRDVRLDLPALAVLPDRAGLLAVRGRACACCPWTAMPMFVAPIAGALSDRIGGAADPRARARAAGDRARLDRGGLDARPSATRRSSARSSSRASAWGCSSRPVANVVLSAVRPAEEGKASGANNAIREVGGVFGVAVLASVFSRYGGYESPETFIDGLVVGDLGRRGRRRRRRARGARDPRPQARPSGAASPRSRAA